MKKGPASPLHVLPGGVVAVVVALAAYAVQLDCVEGTFLLLMLLPLLLLMLGVYLFMRWRHPSSNLYKKSSPKSKKSM